MDERKRCADALLEIGFDGFGLGGWPIDENGNLHEIAKVTAEILPDNVPKYALGVGNPQGIVDAVNLGYTIFDCVLPTRDARHERLYVWKKDPEKIKDIFTESDWYEFLYINKERFVRDSSPISDYCDCHACQNYSKAYIRHLFNIEDSLAGRLATIHNLRFYSQLMEKLG